MFNQLLIHIRKRELNETHERDWSNVCMLPILLDYHRLLSYAGASMMVRYGPGSREVATPVQLGYDLILFSLSYTLSLRLR